MKKSLFFILALSPCLLIAQNRISGKVFDKSNQEVLSGANVFIENSYYATFTDAEGSFQFNSIKSDHSNIIVSFIGYENDTFALSDKNLENIRIFLSPKEFQTEEVIVSATQINDQNPSTKSNLNAKQIGENNMGADIPYLLQQTPSVVTTSDAGAGVGYTGVRIRGIDPTGINITLNGIPINDSESHGVFWVNMPDLASSLSNIQIQRGVGTSTNGAGAFGASINMQTDGLTKKSIGEINNSYGSFNTRKHTVKVGTGLINNRFAMEGRLSKINSDGYIDRASSDLGSYFLSGTYYGKKTIIKAIIFGGRETTYQSWYGTPEARINNDLNALENTINNEGFSDKIANNLRNSDRRYNHYLYDNQVDQYGQDHNQLHFSHQFSEKLTANLSLHYTHGEGYYEEFKEDQDFSDYNLNNINLAADTIESTDLIRRRWLKNDFYGFTYSLLYKPNHKLKFTLGGGANQYEGDHFGEIIWAEFSSNSFPRQNYYLNSSTKTDANSYLKASYQVNKKIIAFVDLQTRFITYKSKGVDNDQRKIDVQENYQFFNPKLGLNYLLNEKNTFSLLFAIGNREPNRSDLIDQDSLANKAEQLQNIEIGYENKGKKHLLGVNLYYMLYKDQLINTGQLNDVGSPIRKNVKSSYRRGIELTGAYAFTKKLKYQANITLSQNQIESFTELTYDYTNGFDIRSTNKGTTDIAFSPSIIANGELVFNPSKVIEIGFQSRYVGEQYLDNTSNKHRKLDAYFVNDLRIEFKIPSKTIREVKVMARVNNIFSEAYSANGYTYTYIVGKSITENFYYPQALRNYMIGLNLKF